jgi:ABC-type transport system substrate-binding protein
VRNVRRSTPLLVLLLALSLVATACGGGGGGKKASSSKFSVTIQTTAENKRRELTEQILQQQLRAAGFDLKIKNVKAGDLFGDVLPKGAYQVGLYSGTATSFFPYTCTIFCSKNIPTAPKFTGNNWQRVNIPALDPILERVDSSLDSAVRMQSNKQADPILAQANVALPLDPLPNILLWSKKITGPVADNPIQGPFWNLEQWTLNNASGGTVVIGAEQEPDCVDWIGSCSGSLWGYYTMNVPTVPHAYTVVKKGNSWDYQPTSLLQGEATLVTSPKQVVTYRINPQAKWSDGQKITSHDFKYVWDQIVNGKDIYDASGYTNIESVDDSNPAQAVVTFSKPYADWKSLFGTQYGLYPSHLLEGKDRNKETAAGYTWSGGPWKIESWQKGTQATLVPNTNYWGPKPKLGKVVIRFITDTSAEFQAFKADETQVIYPQPQPDAVDQIKAGLPNVNTVYTADTGNLEALWFNNGSAPFNDERVRQAFGYAIDRAALVDRLFGALGVKEPMNTINPPILRDYADPTAWAQYKLDLNKVNELMTAAGWAKGSDGIWAKKGG